MSRRTRVQAFDPPHIISWEPGQDSGDGDLTVRRLGLRYDLAQPDRHLLRLTFAIAAARWLADPRASR